MMHQVVSSAHQMADLLWAGYIGRYPFYTKTRGFLIKADSTGNTYTSALAGQVFLDQNENCLDDEPK